MSLTGSLSALKATRWTVSLVCRQRRSHCRRFLRAAMMSSSIQVMSALSVNTDLFKGACLSMSSDSVELYWSTSLARVLARERMKSDAWMLLLKAAWSMDLILRYSLTYLVGAGFSIPSEKWTAWWSDSRSETTVPAMSHWEFESTRSRMWPATWIGSVTCWSRYGWKTGASASVERHHLGSPHLGGRWNHPWWWCRVFCLSLSPGKHTAHRRTNLSWDHFSCLVEDDTVPELSRIFVWIMMILILIMMILITIMMILIITYVLQRSQDFGKTLFSILPTPWWNCYSMWRPRRPQCTYLGQLPRAISSMIGRSTYSSVRLSRSLFIISSPDAENATYMGLLSAYVLGSLVTVLVIAICMIRWAPWLKPCLNPPPPQKNYLAVQASTSETMLKSHFLFCQENVN